MISSCRSAMTCFSGCSEPFRMEQTLRAAWIALFFSCSSLKCLVEGRHLGLNCGLAPHISSRCPETSSKIVSKVAERALTVFSVIFWERRAACSACRSAAGSRGRRLSECACRHVCMTSWCARSASNIRGPSTSSTTAVYRARSAAGMLWGSRAGRTSGGSFTSAATCAGMKPAWPR